MSLVSITLCQSELSKQVLSSHSGYELARHENQIGSPEKPLSDLGYRGYRSYWASVILRTLMQAEDPTTMTIKELSNTTYIHELDVIDALRYTGLLKYVKTANRTSDPSAVTICISRAMVEQAINLTGAGQQRWIDVNKIRWTAQ